jgi:hypothetical protein
LLFVFQDSDFTLHSVKFTCSVVVSFFVVFRLSFFFASVSLPYQPATPHSCLTATRQYARLITVPAHLLTNQGRYRAHTSVHCIGYTVVTTFLMLAGNVELNPGSPGSFMVCTLNIRSILTNAHSTALLDIADQHHPDLFCLKETWIKPTTTSVELIDATKPGYTLVSFSCTPRCLNSSLNIGGGTGFLVVCSHPICRLKLRSSHSNFAPLSSQSSTSIILRDWRMIDLEPCGSETKK